MLATYKVRFVVVSHKVKEQKHKSLIFPQPPIQYSLSLSSQQVDAILSCGLYVVLLQREELSSIPILIACMQLTNHEFLVFISSVLMIRCGDRYFDRIDACGAWMIIHFIVAIGNTSLLTFEFMEDTWVVINASILKKVLVGWKILFLALQIFGMLYCFHVVHKPIVYLKEKKRRTPHPLFSSDAAETRIQQDQEQCIDSTTDNLQTTTRTTGTVTSLANVRPQSLLLPSENEVHFRSNNILRQQKNHGYNRNSCYESYQSITSGTTVDTPIRYSRNPAYESESSLNCVNNYSPYEQIMQSNRNRISYVEPIREIPGVENGIDYGTIGRT